MKLVGHPLASRLFKRSYRQWNGPPKTFALAGYEFDVEPGDWLDMVLTETLSGEARRLLSVKAFDARHLARLTHVPIEEMQIVIRIPSEEKTDSLSTEPPVVPSEEPVVLLNLSAKNVEASIKKLAKETKEWCLAYDDTVVGFPTSLENLAARLVAYARRSNALVVFPSSNAHEPFSFPLIGDLVSPLLRLPSGRSAFEIDAALAKASLPPVSGRPKNPGVVLFARSLYHHLVTTGLLPTTNHSIVAPCAFVFRRSDTRGPVAARLVGERSTLTQEWVANVARARRAVSPVDSKRVPVALYSTEVGPWGGVGVLFEVADGLQRLGMHACVVHTNTTPHNFRPLTPPVKLTQGSELANEWKDVMGAPDGFIIASHWGSGGIVQRALKANPGVVGACFLQDREDQFETTNGQPQRVSDYTPYLSIGRGASVSRWIVESGAKDLGLKPSNFRVINTGLDCSVFHPAPPRKSGGPVRILAMWRPQTEIRRGVARLAAVFEALHKKYGSKISLEVFGWLGPSKSTSLPAGVRHHGVLAPPKVAELMREVDIVVEPSLYQGFGLSGIEGMASGAALVSTQCRGVDEYAIHEENALVVPHDDLQAGVERLIEDSALRLRFQAAGPAAAKPFDWPVICAKWAVYLGELARETAPHLSARLEEPVAKALEVLRVNRVNPATPL